MRFTPAQVSNTRHMAEEYERKALSNARSIRSLRKEMRATMARMAAIEWDAAYLAGHRDTAGLLANIPRMQLALERDVSYIRRYEESMATNVAAALAGKRVLDRYARAQAPRRESGLWVLLQVCLRGWLAGRGKQC